jgi:DNA-binding NtrC family response regulator
MPLAHVVLVAADEGDAAAVSDAVASVRDCRAVRVGSPSWASIQAACPDCDLILLRLTDADRESDLFRFLRDNTKARAPIPVIVLTSDCSPAAKIKLFRMGVVDCLSVPAEMARLAFLIDVLTVRARRGQTRAVRAESGSEPTVLSDGPPLPAGVVFTSPAMLEILAQCRALAPLETTILITGETGTGKTHLARLIHELSPRKTKPFLSVGCGELTSTLVTSELFGHVRGAFTGAEADQPGKLLAAKDGTVLLDDIDCLSLETQARLLRVLDERVVESIGSNRPQPLRARLIVASNRPLEKEVEAGRLRQDLYYRINVAGLALPPLREQSEAIRPLAEKFLADFCRNHGRRIESISSAALALLTAYPWPGNIRELRNVIERAVVMARNGMLDVADLPKAVQSEAADSLPPAAQPTSNQLQRSKSQAEFNRLVEALRRQQNNRRRAARELGVSRVTLYKKLRQYNLM